MPDDMVVATCANAPPPSKPEPPSALAPTKPCPICGKEIPASAIKCTECDSPLGGPNCVACGAPIPQKAKRCWQCDSFQDWRRRIPGDSVTLALLLSILSVIGILAPQVMHFINLRSRTSGFFLDVDRKKSDNRRFIAVRLTNDGGRPALVETARIDFTRTVRNLSKVQGSDLDVVNRNAMTVPAGKTVDLTLYVDNVTFVGAPSGTDSAQNDNYKLQVASDLCTTNAVLTVNIRERDRFNGLEKPQPVTMAMTRDALGKWVLERATGVKIEELNCP